eukprot:gene136-4382_t
MSVVIQFKFLNPLSNPTRKEFSNENTVSNIHEFIVDYLIANKWPKYSKKEIHLLTVYPKKTFTFEHSNLKISEISDGEKRFQMIVKVVQDLMSTIEEEDTEKKVIPYYITCSISKNLLIQPVVTNCGHIFEKENILKWILIKPTCPVCDKSVRNETEIKDVPKELKLKISTFVETSDLIPLEIKEKYKQKMKKMKERKMILIKAKAKAKKLEKLKEKNFSEEYSIWCNSSKQIWFIQLNNEIFPLSIKLVNAINSFPYEYLKIEENLNLVPNLKDDVIFDLTRKNVINTKSEEVTRLFPFESKNQIIYEYESKINEWVQLNDYFSLILHSSIESNLKKFFSIDENCHYDLNKMVRIRKYMETKLRKFIQDRDSKKRIVVWKYQSKNGLWKEFDEKTSKLIETVYVLKGKTVNISSEEGKYQINFDQMILSPQDKQEIYKVKRE